MLVQSTKRAFQRRLPSRTCRSRRLGRLEGVTSGGRGHVIPCPRLPCESTPQMAAWSLVRSATLCMVPIARLETAARAGSCRGVWVLTFWPLPSSQYVPRPQV